MKLFIRLFFIAALTAALFSCRNDNFLTDSSARLDFSVDTVMFDTVFTTIGSTTQQLRVKNNNKQPVKLSSVRLANGSDSQFRLNINGLPASETTNVEIAGNDSMYIFVEVTVDPTNENDPMVIQDSILFELNGNIQDVDLVAYGQDMHVYRNEVIETQTWINDKPHLIYDSIFIDQGHTLTIEAGTRVHFHKNARMFVFGNLDVNGTKEDSVVFQGSRLEYMYTDVPGQWIGIVFVEGSRNNVLEYAVIKNGVIGLNVGTLDQDPENLRPVVRLRNTKIEHMTYAGIYALQANIIATNCLIDNCGVYNMALTMGGTYEFLHCTFASYWPYKVRTEPSVVITNNLVIPVYNEETEEVTDTTFAYDLRRADFGNCIIYGSITNELGLGELEGHRFNYKFDHCLLKADTSIHTTDETHFINPLVNPERFKFMDPNHHDYRLDTLSPAKDYCTYDLINENWQLLEKDLKGDLRDSKPDIGAYERIDK